MAAVQVTVSSILPGSAFQGIRVGSEDKKVYMLAFVDVPRYDMFDASKCQPYGYEAKELLRQHILGKVVNVRVLKEFEKGSCICVATFRGKNIAARLAEAGLAKLREAKGKDVESKEYEEVVAACQRAEKEGLGLYSSQQKPTTVPVIPSNSKVKNDILKGTSGYVKCAIENILDPITFDVTFLPSNFAGTRDDLLNTVYRFRLRITGVRLVNWKPFNKGAAPNAEEDAIMKEINTMLNGKTVFVRLFGLYNTVNINGVQMPVIYSNIYFTDKVITDDATANRPQVTPQMERKEFEAIYNMMDQRSIDNRNILTIARNTDVRNMIVTLTRRDYTYWALWYQLTAPRTSNSFSIRAMDNKGDGYADSPSLKYKAEADVKLFKRLDDIIFNSEINGGSSVITGGEAKVGSDAKKQGNMIDEFLSELPKFTAFVTRIPGSFSLARKTAAKGAVAMNSGVNSFYCIPLDQRFNKTNIDLPRITRALLSGNGEEAYRIIRSHLEMVSKQITDSTTDEDIAALLGEVRVQFARVRMNYEDANPKVSAYETREFMRTILMSGKLNDNAICPGIVTIRTDRVINTANPAASTGGEEDKAAHTQPSGSRRVPSIAGYVFVTAYGSGGDKNNQTMVNEELVKAGYATFIPMTRKIKTDNKDGKGNEEKQEAMKEPVKTRVVNLSELNPDTTPNYRFYKKLAEAAQQCNKVGGQSSRSGGKKNQMIPTPEFIKTSDVVDLKRSDIAGSIMYKPLPCTIESVRISKDSDDLLMNTRSIFVTVATHTPFIIKGKKSDLSNVTNPNVLSTLRLGGITIMDLYETKTEKDKWINEYMAQLLVLVLNNMCNGCIHQIRFNETEATQAPGEFNLVKTTAKHFSFIGLVSINSQFRSTPNNPQDSGLRKATVDLGTMIVSSGLGYVDTKSSDLSAREIQLYVNQIGKAATEAESKKIGIWNKLRSTYKIDNTTKLINAISSDKFNAQGAATGDISGANSKQSQKDDSDFLGGVSVGSVEHPKVLKLSFDTKDKKVVTVASVVNGIIADETTESKRPIRVHLLGISEESDATTVRECLESLATSGSHATVDLLCFGTARLRFGSGSAPQECACGIIYLRGEAPKINTGKVFNIDRKDWLNGCFNSYLVGELNMEYAAASFYGQRHQALAKISQLISRDAADNADM